MNNNLFIASFIGILLATTVVGCQWRRDSHKAAMPDTMRVGELIRHAERCLDKPGSFALDMDSAMDMAGEMERISSQQQYKRGIGLSRLLRAKTLRERGQGAQAREMAAQALEILGQTGTAREKAQALLELGGSYSNEGDDLSPKIALYEQGMQIYARLGEKLSEAQLREFIGDLYQLKHDYPNALSNLKKALSLYQEVGYKRLQGVYGLLGYVYVQTDNFQESLRYNTLAVKIGEEMKDSGSLMASIYSRLGDCYWSMENNQQAMVYYNKALPLAYANKDSFAVMNIQTNIARVLARTKRYRQALDSINVGAAIAPELDVYDESAFNILRLHIYMVMDDLPQAEIYFRKLKKVYDQEGLHENMRQALRYSMASYLVKAGHFKEGQQYLDVMFHMLDRYPVIKSKRATTEYLYYQIDSAAGNLGAAIAHYRNFKSISDSLRNMMQSRQLSELQFQFETEKKDNDIKLLVQKSQAQEASLQKEKIIRNVTIAGVFLLIVFLGLIYSRYRNKKIMNIRLEIQRNEINRQNEDLRRLVDDKEWLLKEIHHRVKNNLQVIISLLNTQSRYLNNKDALDAIRNSQQRMYSMSLIHQRLYQTDNLSKIDMRWYIPELIGYMKDGHEAGNNTEFIVNCEHIELEVVQAVPLGLILNEAVSNSLKYAFPGERKGVITVSLQMDHDKNCQLSISDDGVGIKDLNEALESDSLGMRLMQGLSDQLDGVFSLRNNHPGVFIGVTFPYHEFAPENRKYILN
ncbi:tetratricopeptide repeat protein [Chitinophaga filiformis]|uniref:tetratricopeptide repeat-containing sensor histidine kinase n=1 Tax=Chitinophaga filiformis TaxID=104663 RepID=UPI001F1E6F55|nr:histidine kinase dimerization/phosphoacceptor domain -containing protein [Chitinophaga filiformis]MCF6402801.1 tetratricopeptide repeat protein [Chitinophaga filiformis]MCF6403281.1 tetratricopeptide repeat protein [Chitinophaga filiformis]